MNKPFQWKVFWSLLAACVLGVIALVPYLLALPSSTLAQGKLPLPLPLLISIQILQNVILFAIAISLGLTAANRVGLGLPILEAKLNGDRIRGKIKAILFPSIFLGVVASALVVAIDVYGFQPVLRAELGSKARAFLTSQPAAWKGLLAAFYGGINEEVLMRLCVMSILVWLGSFVSKTAEGKPTAAIFWIANLLAAVLFGLGHLPLTSVFLPLTPLVITRAIVLNGLVGVCSGYLYKKYGLESAMLSHFSADIALHVLLAL